MTNQKSPIKNMITTVTMGPKGQLLVPKRIRQSKGVQPGDYFIAVGVTGGVLFKPINKSDVNAAVENTKRP